MYVSDAVRGGLADSLDRVGHGAGAAAESVGAGELLGDGVDLLLRSGSPLGVVPLRGFGNVGVEFLEAAVGLRGPGVEGLCPVPVRSDSGPSVWGVKTLPRW